MRTAAILTTLALLAGPATLQAQDGQPAAAPPPAADEGVLAPEESSLPPAYSAAADTIQAQLDESILELGEVYERIAEEKVGLSKQLSALQSELSLVKAEAKEARGTVDSRTVEVAGLKNRIDELEREATFLANLLDDYLRKFETRLHAAEAQRYADEIETARLALENTGLSQAEVYAAQLALLSLSMDRLDEALGGTSFAGTALDAERLVKQGTFALIGPLALFRSEDGQQVGTAEQRLGSTEPTLVPFADPLDAEAASMVVATGSGRWPVDPTLGDAHKVAATQETLVEHIEKGGEVGYAIIALAAAAFLVGLFKWIGLSLQRRPSEAKVNALLKAVSQRDETAIQKTAREIRGPAGDMLRLGVAHLKEPKELIEEVMFEKVLTTRLKLERFLPFISISAAAAPLMGLLGTVVGIIETFKTITVMGSSDVKSLSGGISAALITTEFGLIVAIPSLLLHAFLSRKAKGVQHSMETSAVALVNQVAKTPMVIVSRTPTSDELMAAASRPDPDAVRREVKATLADMLAPAVAGEQDR